jgi:hypothetical protein
VEPIPATLKVIRLAFERAGVEFHEGCVCLRAPGEKWGGQKTVKSRLPLPLRYPSNIFLECQLINILITLAKINHVN